MALMTELVLLATLAFSDETVVTGQSPPPVRVDGAPTPSDEEIVVTAAPFRPDAVVVDAEEIASSPGASVADILHWSGACDVYRRGSGQAQADLGYRASTFEQTGVLIDGVPVRDPQTGHFNLDLPLWRGALEAIEISPLPWGPDGLAGAINFVLKPPDEKAFELELGGGDFGLFGTAFNASMPGAGLWGAFEQSDGYRSDTDYDSFSAGAVVEMEEFLSSRGFLGWSSRKFGANDFYGDFPAWDEWEETETFLANWRGRIEAGSSEITPLLYYRRHWDHFLLERDDPSIYENEHTSHTWGGEAAFDWGELRATVEGRAASLESSNLGERAWAAGGASALMELERGELESNIGLRFDVHSGYSSQACPLLSLKWRPAERLSLRASASRAFREPSFTELYYSDPQNVGNPDLDVESAWSLELAAEWRKEGTRALTTVFARFEESLIDWVRTSSSDPWQASNMGEASVLGAEGRLEHRGSWGRASVSYAYLDRQADYDGWESKYALNYPRHRVELRALTREGPWRASARLGVFARTDGQEYVLLEGGVAYAREEWELSVSVTNLFDEDYEEVGGVPMPGTWFRASLRWRF